MNGNLNVGKSNVRNMSAWKSECIENPLQRKLSVGNRSVGKSSACIGWKKE